MRDVEMDYFFLRANGLNNTTTFKMLNMVYEKEKKRV